jgi:hypothetical protein
MMLETLRQPVLTASSGRGGRADRSASYADEVKVADRGMSMQSKQRLKWAVHKAKTRHLSIFGTRMHEAVRDASCLEHLRV